MTIFNDMTENQSNKNTTIKRFNTHKKSTLNETKKKERDQTLPQKTKAKKKKHTHHTTPDPDH